MTTSTDTPKQSFRLSMLIYDSRYRAMTIQIVALMAAMLGAGWLINNTLSNLAALGQSFDFGFFGETAGYDINQRLIDYTSQDTHLRAAVIGLLNTLLIAVMGCVLATVLGVLIGVMRLSPNWLLSRLMTGYVELFRNVPVLLWIVFSMAVLIETLPAPNAFRGDNATASMILFDHVALTNRGVYMPEPLFSRGLGDLSVFGAFGISLDLVALLAVLAAGLFIARAIGRRATRIQVETGLRPTVWYTQLAVIVLPVLAALVALGFYLGTPELKGFNFKGGIHMRNSLIALWLALSLYTASFIAEIVRSGIVAVSKGQTEAASALGLRPNLTMRLVVLPQALRIIIPPMISQYLNLTKNSSLAIAVGYMDITGTLGGITMNQTGRELECVMLLMLVYLVISLSISGAMNWYNNRVKLVER
ncbi:amino acid ABC transporter permease [Actibacterium sp.]|uniref:amino acid ABC transporter permease n=1 Tax=Actibacterium sp. TaxID=1872125 RepID=UPI00356A52B2